MPVPIVLLHLNVLKLINIFNKFSGKGFIKLFEKGVSVEESIKRMRNEGIRRIVVSYKDSAIGRGVLSYENGKFTRLIVIANNPKIIKTDSIDHDYGLTILSMIANGNYTMQSYFLIPYKNIERNAETVRKEVVLV